MFRCWRSRGVATGCRAYHVCGVGTCSVYPRHLSPPERKATRIPKPVWPQGRSGVARVRRAPPGIPPRPLPHPVRADGVSQRVWVLKPHRSKHSQFTF